MVNLLAGTGWGRGAYEQVTCLGGDEYLIVVTGLVLMGRLVV